MGLSSLPATMTTYKQKNKELIFAHQMANALGQAWDIASSPNEREWPDLIVTDGRSKFGLEVREFTKDRESNEGSKLRKLESNNSLWMRQLVSQYYSHSTRPIKVEILGKLESRDDILPMLFKFSKTAHEWQHQCLKLGTKAIIHITKLPDQFSRYDHWKYISDRTGWVRKMCVNDLKPMIASKEKNLEKYRTHLNDVRLMLVADPTFNSGMVSFANEQINLPSTFNQVYLFIYPKEVHKLKASSNL